MLDIVFFVYSMIMGEIKARIVKSNNFWETWKYIGTRAQKQSKHVFQTSKQS